MIDKKMHPYPVLVLPSWFPTATDPTSGDFVERHITAIEPYCKQYVICVSKDEHAQITSDITRVPIEGKVFSGEIIYYKPTRTGYGMLDQFLSDRKYKQLYKKAIKAFIRMHGKPDLIHVHVAQKAGRLALWAKRKWSLPFILSEHWTGYLHEADLKLKDFPFWFKHFNQKIVLHAAAITVVSEHLGKAMKLIYPKMKKYFRIPNVVNPIPKQANFEDPESAAVFIHASTMSHQKNVEDILDALSHLKVSHPNFLLRLFGPSHTSIHAKIRELGLRDHVRLEGNVAHAELLAAMSPAKALIAYSRFETFGCVIIEAHAAGIPVLVSDIPVFHELVTDQVNGLFVAGEQPILLAQTLKELLEGQYSFDESVIRATATNYSYENVGAAFYQIITDVSKAHSGT